MTTVRVFLWGSGGAGQLGLRNSEDFATPQEFHNTTLDPWSITTGGCHSAALSEGGQLYLWGDNEKQQLAQPQEVVCARGPIHIPTGSVVSEDADVVSEGGVTVAVACGWSHTAVVQRTTKKDLVVSWGANDHHQLGRPVTCRPDPKVRLPLELGSGRRVVSLACGWKHSLMALDNGTVFSWGSGRHGELGLGKDTLVAVTPTQVAALDGARISKVHCGWQHSLFHSSETSKIYTCGNNRHGQLGVPKATAAARFQPTHVLMHAASGECLLGLQISVGWHFALCLSHGNELYSWGKGSHGQLGLGSSTSVDTPTRIVGIIDEVVSIACGSEHTMVVTGRGDLYTCGWGEHGNLGHEDTANRATLTLVRFFADQEARVLAARAGGAVSIALTRDNGLRVDT